MTQSTQSELIRDNHPFKGVGFSSSPANRAVTVVNLSNPAWLYMPTHWSSVRPIIH